jgi:N-carbamoylputrescine amidase
MAKSQKPTQPSVSRKASKTEVQLGLIQMAIGPDRQKNLERTIVKIKEAAKRGAQIVCLQELFNGLYFCQAEKHEYFKWAEPADGPSIKKLGKLAGELGVVLIVPFFEKRAAGLYHNSAVIFDADGTKLGIYRKMHIPDDPQFMEKFYFAPGDLGFKAWDTKFGRIGVLICWDQWYPEAARLTALRGADILFYPTAIGWLPAEKAEHGERQYASWETIQRSHAVANGCYVASVNRIGYETPEGEPGIEFWGRSFVADPSGALMAQAGTDQEEILIVTVDLAAVAEQREVWPFLRDRRIDAYEEITKRYID